MSNIRQLRGKWGEEKASQYLEREGYTILERNMRTAHGEIDILALKGNVLTFIEVKTRSTNAFGFPEEAVSFRKQAHLLSAAEAYLQDHPESPETWQFDIIAITILPGNQPEIEHFENVIG